eukprot:2498731-Amphidinium_carterae.1
MSPVVINIKIDSEVNRALLEYPHIYVRGYLLGRATYYSARATPYFQNSFAIGVHCSCVKHHA